MSLVLKIGSCKMKIDKAPVKSKNVKAADRLVGVAEFKVYDNLAEASADLGEARTLEILNIQVKTLAMNTLRQSVAGKTSKKFFMDAALGACSMEELQSVAGDAVKFKALLEKKAAELQAAHEKANPPSSDDTDEEEAA